MLCANPDMVVQRGGQLIYCAGALAREYEKIGGEVVYFGKPYPAIYDLTLETLRKTTGRTLTRPLAVGRRDGDRSWRRKRGGIRCAVHRRTASMRAELGEMTTAAAWTQLFAKTGVHARAAMRELVW